MKKKLFVLALFFMGTSVDLAHAKTPRIEYTDVVFQQAASGESVITARGLWATAHLESSCNPHASNGKYAGLINMGKAEFKKYGAPYGDRMDPLHNLLAATYYMKENAIALKNVLHREPAEAELYISLQQGRHGMIELLRNPRQLAVKVRGHDAIIGNLPYGLRKQAEKWTCAQFVDYWVNRFNETMESEDV